MEQKVQNHPAKVQRLYLQVAEQLMGLLKRGAFKPGHRLPSERDLAHEFGVSRPTIREAMIAMEIAGAVEVRSGSGVYVLESGTRPATVVDDPGPGPFELIEARRLIEGEICTLAAERITDQQLGRLGKLLDVLGQENQCVEDFEAAHQQFHWLIVEAAGNSALSATVAWLWELRNKSEITTRLRQRISEKGIKPIVDDHRAILEALRQRDGAAARQALNRHLEWLVEYLMKAR